MSNSDIEQTGTVKGNLPNEASLSGRISNGLNLSGRISIGSGSSDFIINMTVTTTDGETFTVTSCDATREQINAAVAADKRVVLRVSAGDTRYELPMVYSYQGYVYLFTAFISGSLIYAVIEPVGENENEWSFVTTQIKADAITYSNSSLSNVSDVKGALNELVSDSHTHLNKTALDKFSETDGNLTYNGEPIGGEDTIYIPAKLNQLDETFTIETSVTFEQIDTAYQSGQEQILKLFTDDSNESIHLLPLVLASPGQYYYFGILFNNHSMLADVLSNDEWGFARFNLSETSASNVSYNDTTVKGALDDLGSKSHTHSNKDILDKFGETNGKPTYNGETIGVGDITAEDVAYTYPNQSWTNAKQGLDEIMVSLEAFVEIIGGLGEASHTHANKDTLDKLSVSNGKLQYNGSDVGLKGDTPVKGTDYWTPADKQEIVADTLAALPTWTGGSY